MVRFLNPAQERLSTFGTIPEEQTTYAGCDLRAVMYMPLYTMKSAQGINVPKIKVFAELQTLSISSTRSVSPVRVFGRSQPLAYCKGAVTIAGTMVFAAIEKDVFSEIYDVDIAESYLNASTSIIAHQLPPFSIVITLANEKGASGIQIIHGITITNYGTTYSINDLYTEQVYTYIATDVTPLLPYSASQIEYQTVGVNYNRLGKNVSTLVAENLDKEYGRSVDMFSKITRKRNEAQGNTRLI